MDGGAMRGGAVMNAFTRFLGGWIAHEFIKAKVRSMKPMERIEYKNILDRTDWRAGPWDNEPDKVQWQDDATRLPCLIVRNHSGALCGYVGVDESHPLYGKEYDEPDVDVHGGLTFADACQESEDGNENGHGICHIAGPGEPDRVWWFGFDCAHFMDDHPTNRLSSRIPSSSYPVEYRDVSYVAAQCAKLARQLKEAT